MTTDTTELQERIARAIYGAQFHSFFPDDLDEAPKWLQVTVRTEAAAVLPIIRSAQADAWDEGLLREQKRCDDLSFFDGYDFDEPSNPYREQED